MFRALILLTASLAVAQVSAAESAYVPPQPGTMVTWQYEFGDEAYIQLGEVVAAGEDFAIYNPDIRVTDASAADYLVEFSGLHSTRCDEQMPSDEERAALAKAWPLNEGAFAAVRSGVTSSYRVLGPSEAEVISEIDGAGSVHDVEAFYGSVSMTISVSPALGMPVAISWPTGDHVAVLEVIEPQGSIAPTDIDTLDLGQCGELLP